VPIDLRDEIGHPPVLPHQADELVAPLRIDVPLASDVIHFRKHLSFGFVAVEPDERGIGPKLLALRT
jgi:hypothetical protein